MSVDFVEFCCCAGLSQRLYSSSDSKKVSDSSQNIASTWQMQNYALPILSWKLVYSNERKQSDQELVQSIKKYVMCLS